MVSSYRNTLPPISQLRNEMDRLLTGVWGQMPDWAVPAAVRGQPSANVWETDDAIMVEAEVPGVKSEQLDISVVGNELTLKVERPDVAAEGLTYHRRERPVGNFSRILRLPDEVDADHVEAQLRDGVLTITLPKAPSAKPRRIKISNGN